MPRLSLLLPGLWAGMLLSIALIAAPAAFATLEAAQAGRVVGRLFRSEAMLSMVFALVVVLLERRRARTFTRAMLLALGVLFCTVAGYFALQPLMDSARDGQGNWSFGQLHALSLVFYGLKTALVGVLAWTAASPLSGPTS